MPGTIDPGARGASGRWHRAFDDVVPVALIVASLLWATLPEGWVNVPKGAIDFLYGAFMAHAASFSTSDGRKVKGRLVSNDDETETWRVTVDGSAPRYVKIPPPDETLERALLHAPNENTRRVLDQELRAYREQALAAVIENG